MNKLRAPVYWVNDGREQSRGESSQIYRAWANARSSARIRRRCSHRGSAVGIHLRPLRFLALDACCQRLMGAIRMSSGVISATGENSGASVGAYCFTAAHADGALLTPVASTADQS